MTALSGVEDLHVEAMNCALWEVETAIISEGWAYSFSSSGDKVYRERWSSRGGVRRFVRKDGDRSSVEEDSLFERPRTGRFAVDGRFLD
jgi:hypothetical protein